MSVTSRCAPGGILVASKPAHETPRLQTQAYRGSRGRSAIAAIAGGRGHGGDRPPLALVSQALELAAMEPGPDMEGYRLHALAVIAGALAKAGL